MMRKCQGKGSREACVRPALKDAGDAVASPQDAPQRIVDGASCINWAEANLHCEFPVDGHRPLGGRHHSELHVAVRIAGQIESRHAGALSRLRIDVPLLVRPSRTRRLSGLHGFLELGQVFVQLLFQALTEETGHQSADLSGRRIVFQ